jgi:hypothetical protein
LDNHGRITKEAHAGDLAGRALLAGGLSLWAGCGLSLIGVTENLALGHLALGHLARPLGRAGGRHADRLTSGALTNFFEAFGTALCYQGLPGVSE